MMYNFKRKIFALALGVCLLLGSSMTVFAEAAEEAANTSQKVLLNICSTAGSFREEAELLKDQKIHFLSNVMLFILDAFKTKWEAYWKSPAKYMYRTITGKPSRKLKLIPVVGKTGKVTFICRTRMLTLTHTYTHTQCSEN